jgi:hypothetical protein
MMPDSWLCLLSDLGDFSTADGKAFDDAAVLADIRFHVTAEILYFELDLRIVQLISI